MLSPPMCTFYLKAQNLSEPKGAISEAFLDKLLREFGLEWTALTVLSGIAFSSFNLDVYLNPGVWALGVFLGFSVGFLFKRYVSGNFLTVSLICLTLSAALLAGGIAILFYNNIGVLSFMKNFSAIATLYVAVSVCLPLGFGILSYKAQDDVVRFPLPTEIMDQLKTSVVSSDFYHDSVDYSVRLSVLPSGLVEMWFRVEMQLRNRLKRDTVYEDTFDPTGTDTVYKSVTVNSSQRIIETDMLTRRGLVLRETVPAGGNIAICVEACTKMQAIDSEHFSVHFPARRMVIRLGPSPAELHTSRFLLTADKSVRPITLPSGEMEYDFSKGVLPFEGIRLFWQPMSRD